MDGFVPPHTPPVAVGLALTLPRLNAQEQRELQSRMEKKQMKEFMNV
jgi:hypothetical protein